MDVYDPGNFADMLLDQQDSESVNSFQPNRHHVMRQPQGYSQTGHRVQPSYHDHQQTQELQTVHPQLTAQEVLYQQLLHVYAVDPPNPPQPTHPQPRQGSHCLDYQQTAQVLHQDWPQPSYEAPLDQIFHQPVQAETNQLPAPLDMQPQPHMQGQHGQASTRLDDVLAVIQKDTEEELTGTESSYDSLLRKLAGTKAQPNSQLLNDPIQSPDSTAVTVGTAAALANHTPSPGGPFNTIVTVMPNHEPQPSSSMATAEMPLTNQIAAQSSRGVPGAILSSATNHIAPSETSVLASHHPLEIVDLTKSDEDHPTVGTACAAIKQVKNSVSSTVQANKKTKDVPATKSKSNGKTKKGKRPTRAKSDKPTAQLSSLETEPKKVKTDKEPDLRQLEIRLFYQTSFLDAGSDDISSRDGCLVFSEKCCIFKDSRIDSTRIEFPKLGKESEKMTAKQKEATQTILNALAKGIHIYCDDECNIFARRLCKSHVFCYSTVPGEGFECFDKPTENQPTENQPTKKQPTEKQPTQKNQYHRRCFKKLALNDKVKVFDGMKFLDWLRFSVGMDPNCIPIPTVVFTFGQTWEKGFPLNNCLVYMKVTQGCCKYKRDVLIASKKSESAPSSESAAKSESLQCDDIDIALSTLSLSIGEGSRSGPIGNL